MPAHLLCICASTTRGWRIIGSHCMHDAFDEPHPPPLQCMLLVAPLRPLSTGMRVSRRSRGRHEPRRAPHVLPTSNAARAPCRASSRSEHTGRSVAHPMARLHTWRPRHKQPRQLARPTSGCHRCSCAGCRHGPSWLDATGPLCPATGRVLSPRTTHPQRKPTLMWLQSLVTRTTQRTHC